MDILRELVHIITKNKVKSIEVINGSFFNKNQVGEFYEGIRNGHFETDDDASNYFYQTDKTAKNYKKLKSKLKRRLINTVFFIDVKQPSYNEQQRAYYSCCKDWAAAKILLGKGARSASIDLCHKILKQARKYEFNELLIDVCRALRLHYGAREGNIKKYDYYNKLFKQHLNAWQAENLAEEYYAKLVIHYVKNKSTKDALYEQAMAYYEQLQTALNKYPSYKLHLHGGLIRIIAHMSRNDYTSTINACIEAIQFFETKKYVAKHCVQIFLHQQLVCHTQMRQYAKGKSVAERCLDLLHDGTFNWFKHQELYLTLSMHTEEYQQAYLIFNKSIRHKRFKFLNAANIEIWKIYEAYIYYLISIEKIAPIDPSSRLRKFRLGKFLNEVPTFSKDKRGMNIPILIIQVLFMIFQKKYDQAIDRIETIEKYCSRYLRKDSNFRSNCFIKMLLQIPISGFHKAGTIRRASKLILQLKSVPLKVANQTHEIEIIPYEDLWELVIKSLEPKFYRQRKMGSP